MADSITRDVATNKFSVNGIFDELVATEFPLIDQSLLVYVSITNCRTGPVRLSLRLTDVDNHATPCFR
jgi:hypothetical protein